MRSTDRNDDKQTNKKVRKMTATNKTKKYAIMVGSVPYIYTATSKVEAVKKIKYELGSKVKAKDVYLY